MSTQELTRTASPKRTKASRKPANPPKTGKPKNVAKASKPKSAKSGSKAEKVLELMKRKEGATLGEIAKETDWQSHSICGFESGHVAKKLGLLVRWRPASLENARWSRSRTLRLDQ